ncbi:C6 zinc finger domain protein [Penicillium herquei]|nr:C6 zinc finger domain protein [Penicillium herquei]
MNDNLEEEPLAPNQEPAKRRKIRKGTRSCWECKHRKIRCIFLSPNATTCVECQRRRATCIGQNLPEDLVPSKQPSNSRHLGERIARIENIIQNLVVTQSAQTQKERPSNEPLQQEEQTNQPSNSIASLPRRYDQASAFSVDSPDYESSGEGETQDNAHTEKETNNSHSEMRRAKRKLIQANSYRGPTGSWIRPGTDIPTLQRPFSPSDVATLHHLLAAFPSRDNVKILAKQSARPSLYTHLTNFQPHNKLTRDALATANFSDAVYPIALSPGPDMHPVLLARQMIIFAITLQSPCGEKVNGLLEPQEVLMRRLMTAATTWVTKKEEWQGTLESVLCIMLEGVFEVNCGNLRRAWSVYRRAMTVAQLMGLHRASLPP